VWMPHWGLTRDPFAEIGSPYVSLPSHNEAVARVVFAVETLQRRAIFGAPAGLGKTAVMRRVFSEVLSPRRRLAAVSCPQDGTRLFILLAERLGQRVGREPSRLAAWRALERAIRLASLQAYQVVVIIDDCDDQVDATVRRDLDSLDQFGSMTSSGLTIIQLERTDGAAQPVGCGVWSPTIGLERLTRSQTETYLATKLEWAGSTERIFTPRALTRIHALSLGVPRAVEQLASICLTGGAVRGLEVINPELVDAAAPAPWAASFAGSH
jgi:type II secretory pathway predicted ATPase ExeA